MSSSTSSFDPVWRRFFALAAGTAAITIAIIYAFVVIVDPWNTLPLSPPFNRAPVTSNQRFAYPALARSPRFDSAVIGTSSSRLLRPAELNEAFHARFANLAMNDATVHEEMLLLSVFLRAHPRPKLLLLGLDDRWCVTGDAPRIFSPRPFPEWMYLNGPWRGYREMLNMFAVQEAGKEFGVLTKIKKEDLGRDGYTVFVPPDDRYDAARAAAHLRDDGMVAPAGARVGPPETWTFTSFDELRPILDGLSTETRTILFFVPYNQVNIPPPESPLGVVWDECRRRAIASTAGRPRVLLVDFLLPSPITTNDGNYWDSQHYRVGVATTVVRDLLRATAGEASPDYRILHAAQPR